MARKNRTLDPSRLSAGEAQLLAHYIAFGPITFQVSRLMVSYGIFAALEKAEKDTGKGLTLKEIEEASGLSGYAVKVLMESSLTLGSVIRDEDGLYLLSKVGWFLQNDQIVKVNLDFNHYINYKGMFHLDEALEQERPAGLPELGPWPTIYEGLSSLPPKESESWFAFDHHFSDVSFSQALPIVFKDVVHTLLDVGGNTGKFAMACTGFNPDVQVTILDLPQQIGLMKTHTAGKPGSERISGIGGNLLDPATEIPQGFDVVWMSQFLDCFSYPQVVSILSRVAGMFRKQGHGRLFIMENIWDRQKYAAAAFDIAQTNVYFTALANGNSKMFSSDDLLGLIDEAGFKVVEITDGLGEGHSLFQCVLKES